MKNVNKSFLIIYVIFTFIQVSSNAQWQQANNGLTDIFVTSLAVSGSNLLAGTNIGIYVSTDFGNSWTAANSGSNNISVSSFVVAGNNLFAVSVYKGVYISTDTGVSWTAINEGITEPSSVISIFASGGNLFAGTTNAFGIFLSTNNGTSWKAVNNGLGESGDVYSFAISGVNLFVGTARGGIFLTTDNGTNWTNKGLNNTWINSLAFIDTILFAGTGEGVYRSGNNGNNWIALNNGMTNAIVVSLAASNPYLFAATNNGNIFLSKNNGNNWTAVDSGLVNTTIRSLVIFNGYLFVVTNGSGVWKRLLTDMIVSVKEPKTILPSNFSLEQNYPNPFNPTTSIEFRIASASGGGLVTLKVYDILGREVATLVNEEKPARNYEVKFDGSGLSSGIYFYKLNTENFISVKKMILMK
jgi:photosystem II stability/assembly factor-like uncharacterized protein